MSKELCLFVPDLFWPEPDDQEALKGLVCPALEKLLARTAWAHFHQSAPRSHEHVLVESFSGSAETPLAAAFAPIRASGETNERADGLIYCVDPVHLRFHHEQILLADPGAFGLSTEETTQFIHGLNRDFADIGEFFAVHPERWYVRLHPNHGDLVADLPPLSAVAGRRLVGDALHLKTSQSDTVQKQFRQWQNEIQMWLHAHPLNEIRLTEGKPAVNGVWFWGGGVLEKVLPKMSSEALNTKKWDAVYAAPDQALASLARGLARSVGVEAQVLPRPPNGIQGQTFVVWDALVKPTLYEDAETWRKAVEQFDREWLSPMLASSLPFILIVSGIYGEIRLDRRDYRGWQFWKPIKPLDDVLQKLALNQ